MPIPDADVIIDAIHLTLPGVEVVEKAIRAAVQHSRSLARWPVDEPAAIFFAFACRPRAVPALGARLTVFLTREQIRELALVLEATDADLRALRMRVLVREVSYDDVRDWFAARMPGN